MPASNATTRFSDLVENYIKFRPHYPREIITFLRAEVGLRPDWTVADLGSGTGISAEIFLENGNRVELVEPNEPMRKAGDAYLAARFTNYASHDGTAEATGLPSGSIDLVVAGQAFHWFDIERTRVEVIRVLKPSGFAAILWNDRLTEGSDFLVEYEALLKHFGTDYASVDHRNVTPEAIARFFGTSDYLRHEFQNSQTFGYEGIEGRLLSSSYVPKRGEPRHAEMLAELRRIFDSRSEEGKATFLYRTQLYLGRLSR